MMKSTRRLASRVRTGFTLIEVMAGVLLTAIVITVAVSFQMNLGSATDAARERLRTQRQAVALLDRIAKDLASAYFIAPSERVKEGVNPWVFIADRDFVGDNKSDKIKFMTRNYEPQSVDGHASDLAVVAYYLRRENDRPGYQLMRWRETRMPIDYDPDFPAEDDPVADVIGENLKSFHLSLYDSTGSEVADWNSTSKRGRDSMPVAVKIEITMLDPNELDPDYNRDGLDSEDFDLDNVDRDDDGEEDLEIEDESEDQSGLYSKLVILPLRPLDWSFLEAEVRTKVGENNPNDANAGDEDDDADEGGISGGTSGNSGNSGGDSNDNDDDFFGDEEKHQDGPELEINDLTQ